MDNDVQDRFEQLENRVGDIKSMMTTLATSISGIFAVVSIFLAIYSITGLSTERERIKEALENTDKRVDRNLNTESDKIKELSERLTKQISSETSKIKEEQAKLQNEIDNSLGKLNQNPKVILLDEYGKNLSNRIISAKLETEKEKIYLILHIILKNIGNKITDPIYVKTYFSEPIKLSSKSTDEEGYQYEDLIGPNAMGTTSILPAGVSLELSFRFHLTAVRQPISGTLPILMKVYYGGAESSNAAFQIKFEDH